MGLDMYLTAKRGFYPSLSTLDAKLSVSIHEALTKEDALPADFEVRGVEVRAGYWRKANAIHSWFVDNVQNGIDECQEAEVERGQLKDLRDICQGILDGKFKAEDALPTKGGFFFGSTDYDDGYKADLRETIEQIDKALTLPDDWDFVYQSSW